MKHATPLQIARIRDILKRCQPQNFHEGYVLASELIEDRKLRPWQRQEFRRNEESFFKVYNCALAGLTRVFNTSVANGTLDVAIAGHVEKLFNNHGRLLWVIYVALCSIDDGKKYQIDPEIARKRSRKWMKRRIVEHFQPHLARKILGHDYRKYLDSLSIQ